jgi:hypothetical protein
MRRNPLYVFKNEGSVGIMDIPINSVVQILASSSGRVLVIELLSKANLTVGATIAHLLQYPNQYNILSDGTSGGELVQYQDIETGYKLDLVDRNLYGNVGKDSIDFSSQLGTTTFDGGATGELAIAWGLLTTASGAKSTSTGTSTLAQGENSFSGGDSSLALERNSFSFGIRTKASGLNSIAIGRDTEASGQASFAGGVLSLAQGLASNATGYNTRAGSDYSHSEGFNTSASGISAHSEGHRTVANAAQAHAEGSNTLAEGVAAHAEGEDTKAIGRSSHSEGILTEASGNYSHSEGDTNISLGVASHTGGKLNIASADMSFAHGLGTEASGLQSTSWGNSTHASGDNSFALGNTTISSGESSVAGGYKTTAGGQGSRAFGTNSKATGRFSHAEGGFTSAEGDYSHAEGFWTISSGRAGTSLGYKTQSQGINSFASGDNTKAIASESATFGSNTIAVNPSQLAIGRFNTSEANSLFEIGSGTSIQRENSLVVFDDGRVTAPKLTPQNIVDAKSLVTKEYVDAGGSSSIWGNLSGILSNQLDLQSALDNKENHLGLPDANGSILVSDLSGNRIWATSSILGKPTKVDFNSSANQTVFIVAGQLFIDADVFVNGILVQGPSYTITNDGTNTKITFNTGLQLDSWVRISYYKLQEINNACNILPESRKIFIVNNANQVDFNIYGLGFDSARVIIDGKILRRIEYQVINNGIYTTIHLNNTVPIGTKILVEFMLPQNFGLFDLSAAVNKTQFTLNCQYNFECRIFIDGVLQRNTTYNISSTVPSVVTFDTMVPAGAWILVEHNTNPEPLREVINYDAAAGETIFTVVGLTFDYARVYKNGILINHSDVCVSNVQNDTIITLTNPTNAGDWIAVEHDLY